MRVLLLGNPSKKTKQLQEMYKIPLDITFKGSFDQVLSLKVYTYVRPVYLIWSVVVFPEIKPFINIFMFLCHISCVFRLKTMRNFRTGG